MFILIVIVSVTAIVGFSNLFFDYIILKIIQQLGASAKTPLRTLWEPLQRSYTVNHISITRYKSNTSLYATEASSPTFLVN